MNTIFEAVKKDGTHELVSPAVIAGIVRTAKLYAKTGAGAFRKTGQMLSNMMYCKGYEVLTQIKYGHDGSQERTVICSRSI